MYFNSTKRSLKITYPHSKVLVKQFLSMKKIYRHNALTSFLKGIPTINSYSNRKFWNRIVKNVHLITDLSGKLKVHRLSLGDHEKVT